MSSTNNNTTFNLNVPVDAPRQVPVDALRQVPLPIDNNNHLLREIDHLKAALAESNRKYEQVKAAQNELAIEQQEIRARVEARPEQNENKFGFPGSDAEIKYLHVSIGINRSNIFYLAFL